MIEREIISGNNLHKYYHPVNKNKGSVLNLNFYFPIMEPNIFLFHS